MLKLRAPSVLAFTLLACAAPATVLAAEPLLTPMGVVADAAPLQKLIMLSLMGSIVAAIAITGAKLARGPALTGGSAFVSGLRLGGPLIGILGATYCAMLSAIGVTNLQPTDMRVIAPGIAESLLVFGLGVLAGSIAVFCHWLIEARIDRAVLKTG